MLVKTYGSAVYGVDAITITVEVNVTDGLYTFLVGLPDDALKESVSRIESAIKTNDFFMPRTKIIINLAPAGIRKSGAAFDLPIALGILAASGQIPFPERLREYVIMGELGLDGVIHPIKGALSMAIQAKKDSFKRLIMPTRNAREASLVKGLEVFPFGHIREVIEFLKEGSTSAGVAVAAEESQAEVGAGHLAKRIDDLAYVGIGDVGLSDIDRDVSYTNQLATGYVNGLGTRSSLSPMNELDFSEVKGHVSIKRALEIAATGGHNALMIGPPGVGKTMLAQRLPSILPPLSLEEALETTRIHSVAGKLPADGQLIRARPFRSPHHTISAMALVGGSSNPQPGEISLAHNGVLFLDELPEFNRNVLEVLRQPMEERKIMISRAAMSVEFPANFMLLASMNPCPCGYYRHPEKECVCPSGAIFKYLHRISGPLMDRIDLHIEVSPVPHQELAASPARPENSLQMRERVVAAREMQTRRYVDMGYAGIYCNAQISGRTMREVCRLDSEGEELLQTSMKLLNLSARAYDRILKVSRTIADLEGMPDIVGRHVAEAVQYRSLDREKWV